MSAIDPRTPGLGVRLLLDADDQFTSVTAGSDTFCLRAGRPGYQWEQETEALRPKVKSDSNGNYLEFDGTRWMQADALASLFGGDPAEWTMVAIYDTTDLGDTGHPRVVMSLDGTDASYARLRADKYGVVAELHNHTADPDVYKTVDAATKTNIPLKIVMGGPISGDPRAGRPNLLSASAGPDGYGWTRKDGGYSSTWNMTPDPNDPEPDPNLRRFILAGRRTGVEWSGYTDATPRVAFESSDNRANFKYLTLGGGRRGAPAVLQSGFVGKIYRVAMFDRKLTEPEIRGVETWLRDSLEKPENCRFAAREGYRYVSPPGFAEDEGDFALHLGLFEDEPLLQVAKAAIYFSPSGGKVVVRSSEDNPHRGEYVQSRPFSLTIEPWPGYERVWWFGSVGFPTGLTWTPAPLPGAPDVYSLDLSSRWESGAIPKSTPCIHFTTLFGPLGADEWSLRKQPGNPRPEGWVPGAPYWDATQFEPAFGEYGWDGEAKKIYVNIGQNPSDLPFELGAGCCVTAWQGRLTVRNVNGRYAYNGIFGCGDATAGAQTRIQGEADYIDCYGRNAGPAGSAFFLRAHGKRLRAYRPVAAYSANDSFGAHRDRATHEEQRMEIYDAVGYGAQDENLSFHEGVSGGAYRFWFWNSGDGNVTSVAVREPRVRPTDAFDVRPTSMALVGGFAWQDGQLPTDHGRTKLVIHRGITFNDPGMRGRVVGCTLDSTVKVDPGTPESYVVRSGNRENVPTAQFSPPPARPWAPYF